MTWSGPLFGNRLRASSFGDDAEQYDRVRPPYPPAMIDVLLTDDAVSVLDVGCGTGIASRLFSARGCEVLGLEPDARMAAVARRNGVTIEAGTFETWDAHGRRFDLLIAGQAWHWVDPHVGAVKASEVLRPGVASASFGTRPFPIPRLERRWQRWYAQHASSLGAELGADRAARRCDVPAPLLTSPGVRDGSRTSAWRKLEHEVSYSTAQWLELATTHSDHRTLPEQDLQRLLEALRTVIDAIGGLVEVRYETMLVTGRTRSA